MRRARKKQSERVVQGSAVAGNADGRVVEKTGSFAQTNVPQPVSGNAFNLANEMTAFNGTALTYDLNGNLINDGTNTYSWDARNHLTSLSGGGRRNSRVSSRCY